MQNMFICSISITNLVREAASGMLLDAHVDEGAGRGQRGLHLSEAMLHSLKEVFSNSRNFLTEV